MSQGRGVALVSWWGRQEGGVFLIGKMGIK